eukprot:TRINITY_DN9980_c0_g1_i1.p1 TRINITY_DN9980_c0_g1~~TRINITY_DN9980_c0_g1_i1.p1  ORF type:complete len:285 (+),score=78.53 TRINITY_DN9980_c0_g1_i1:80-934(+)
MDYKEMHNDPASPAKYKVAVVQMTSVSDKEVNFQTIKKLIEQAKSQGVVLVSLPECFGFFAGDSDEKRSGAEPLEGEFIGRYRRLAADNDMWMSLGGFHERAGDKVYNTHAIISNTGEIVKVYRKMHLFKEDIEDGEDEGEATTRGEEMCIADTVIGSAGLGICYDLRFPEFWVSLRKHGAKVMLIPAAWTKASAPHWKVLLMARAVETQSFVLAANQTGDHNDHRSSSGNAMIISPWGEVLSEMDPKTTGLVVSEIDLTKVDEIRDGLRVVDHRRDDLYNNFA